MNKSFRVGRLVTFAAFAFLFLAMPRWRSGLPAFNANAQERTAEQVAELTIFANGGRAVLAQIRRNGIERARLAACMALCLIEDSPRTRVYRP